jgi:hypothetical protein
MSRTPRHPITDEPVDLVDPAADPDNYRELEQALVEKKGAEVPPPDKKSKSD